MPAGRCREAGVCWEAPSAQVHLLGPSSCRAVARLQEGRDRPRQSWVTLGHFHPPPSPAAPGFCLELAARAGGVGGIACLGPGPQRLTWRRRPGWIVLTRRGRASGCARAHTLGCPGARADLRVVPSLSAALVSSLFRGSPEGPWPAPGRAARVGGCPLSLGRSPGRAWFSENHWHHLHPRGPLNGGVGGGGGCCGRSSRPGFCAGDSQRTRRLGAVVSSPGDRGDPEAGY